ncbi:DUF1534 domain-containing protein [Pseudomonas savastanoi pv. phaseolicola]|nr:DUF1534 domain-containing protein [Pseudomonas savastanoi pv. phaseolicola]MBN3475064.1 DUF1534 domain-containing protein [Pseudomonas savastanoi pv. phaseolicola]
MAFLTFQARRLSFLTLQRGNAVGDAPRHKSAPRRPSKIGRGASRKACDAERRTMIKREHNKWSPLTSRPCRSSNHLRARSGGRCRSLVGEPCSACFP